MQNLEDVYRELQRLIPVSSEIPKPVAAGVIVLWRQLDGLEVYLGKRAPTMRFLPGFWTFPGGKQESGDAGPEAASCRELAEETSVRLPALALRPAGRWITPTISPLRFDTLFFLAELPSGQEPNFQCSGGELVDGAWWRPAAALQAFEEGRLLMPAPVVHTLEALVPGISGACERAKRAAALDHEQGTRLWPIAGGVSVSPLRTPTLPPATHTNCIVVGTQELVLIDPAAPDADEREAICLALDRRVAQGQEIKEIWLTHHHADHVGAAEFLAQRYRVPICAHVRSAKLLQGRCRVDQHLEDGERRLLRGRPERELECVFTPGHAPGHLCFLERRTRVLIAGDMVAAVGTILIDPSEGDMAAYLDSLERMRALKPRLLLPAHGFALSDPEAIIDHYREHRLMREERVLSALKPEPRSSAELVVEVYSDTPPVLHGLAERSLLAHLIKLEREGRAGKVQSKWVRR